MSSYTAGILGRPVIQTVAANFRSVVFTGLTNGESVQLRVRASSGAGDGPYSAALAVTPAGPPGPPGSVTAQLLSDGRTVRVAWAAPTNTNGAAVESYTIQSTNILFSLLEVGGETVATTLDELPPGIYSLTVTAANSAGSSEPSAPSQSVHIAEPAEPSPGGSLTPSITLPHEVRDSLVQGVGVGAAGTDSPIDLQSEMESIVLRLPIELTSEVEPGTISMDVEIPGLNLNFKSGSGTFDLSTSDETMLRGTGTLRANGSGLVVAVDRLELIYSPALTANENQAGTGINFQVDVEELPGNGRMTAVQVGSIAELDISPAKPPVNPLSPNGAALGEGDEEIALLVQVTLDGLGETVFGSNLVNIEVDPTWLADRRADRNQIVLIKISETGTVFAREPECSTRPSGSMICTTTFDGVAGGFSSFGLFSIPRSVTPTTPTPELLPSATPTTGPIPTAPPTATSVSRLRPTPTPTSGTAPAQIEPSVDPSATPLPLPSPTVLPPAGGNGNGNGLLTALLALTIGGALAAGGVLVWRMQRGAFFTFILATAVGK